MDSSETIEKCRCIIPSRLTKNLIMDDFNLDIPQYLHSHPTTKPERSFLGFCLEKDVLISKNVRK